MTLTQKNAFVHPDIYQIEFIMQKLLRIVYKNSVNLNINVKVKLNRLEEKKKKKFKIWNDFGKLFEKKDKQNILDAKIYEYAQGKSGFLFDNVRKFAIKIFNLMMYRLSFTTYHPNHFVTQNHLLTFKLQKMITVTYIV